MNYFWKSSKSPLEIQDVTQLMTDGFEKKLKKIIKLHRDILSETVEYCE